MTIYAFYGETDGMIPSDSTVIEDTTAGNFDSGFARCAVKIPSKDNYAQASCPTAMTSNAWLRFDIAGASFTGSPANQAIFLWTDNSLASWVRLMRDPTNNNLRLERYTGSAWVLIGSETTVPISGQLQSIVVHAVVNTSSGSVDVYVAGTKRIASGIVDLSAVANLKDAFFYGWGNSGNGAANWISQVAYANESLVGKQVGLGVMTGNGANTAWTGDYTAIDEAVRNDGDTISSGTNDQVETYTATFIPNFTGYKINAVCIPARAKKSASGPQQMQMAVRSAGTVYTSSTLALDAGYTSPSNVWSQNPGTSADFLSSELSGLEFGVKSKA